MTEYKKLCEDLRAYHENCDECNYSPAFCDLQLSKKAADAIESLQAKNKHMNDLLDSALKDMETAQAENERLNAHADYCESERDGYKDEVELLSSDLDRIIQMNSRLEGEIDRWRVRCSKADQRADKLKKENESLCVTNHYMKVFWDWDRYAKEVCRMEIDRLTAKLDEYHKFDGFLVTHGCFDGEEGKA